MLDRERLEEFLEHVADRYTGPELIDLLDLDIWRIIYAFEEEIVEQREKLEL